MRYAVFRLLDNADPGHADEYLLDLWGVYKDNGEAKRKAQYNAECMNSMFTVLPVLGAEEGIDDE